MHPPKVTLEDLVARMGAEPCKAYARITRVHSRSYLEARQIHPESILILNLIVRESELAKDYDCSSWLFIAPDGCGNYHFVDARQNATCVKLLSHDPPGIEVTELTLDNLVSVAPVPFREPREEKLVICRTDSPGRSILDPIALDEWTAVAAGNRQIDVTGYRRGTNPFSGEIIKFPTKGGAYIECAGSEIFAQLLAGRIQFGEAPPDFTPFAARLAQSLQARLFIGSRLCEGEPFALPYSP